jgi:hypothetical protein
MRSVRHLFSRAAQFLGLVDMDSDSDLEFDLVAPIDRDLATLGCCLNRMQGFYDC